MLGHFVMCLTLYGDINMYRYHVTYYYLASGMEGNADTKDYGIVWANNSDQARMMIAKQISSNLNDIAWVMGCLTAKKVR